MKKYPNIIFGTILIIVYYLVTYGETHMLPNYNQIFKGFIDLYTDHNLIYHILKSLQLFFKGLFFALCVSLPLVYFSKNKWVKPIPTFLSKMRYLPMVGFTYYASLVFNSSSNIQSLMLCFFLSTFLITSLLSLIDDIDVEEWQHAETLGLSQWQIIKEVIILGRLDYVIDIVRQNLAISFMMIVSIEMIMFGNGGLGTLLRTADKWDNQGRIVALQLIILVIAFISDISFNHLRKRYFRYTF